MLNTYTFIKMVKHNTIFDGSRNIRVFIFSVFVLFVWLQYYNLNKMNLFGLSFILYFFKLSYGSNKQITCRLLLTNCLSVFQHVVGLAIKRSKLRCGPLALTLYKAFYKNEKGSRTSLPASFSARFLKKNFSHVTFY